MFHSRGLNFFLNYSDEVIEPLWSFDQYFEFILVLFYSTGLAFQIPIIQILLGLLNFVSAQQMLGAWRYIILISTIIGAVLTPSTDPLTQLLLSFAILLLYFSGVGILFLIKNYKMTQEQLIKIIEEQKDLKNLPNNNLITMMDIETIVPIQSKHSYLKLE